MICTETQAPFLSHSSHVGRMTDDATRDPWGWKARIRRLGLEQKDVAAAMGWGASKVSRALSGRNDLPGPDRNRFITWLAAEELNRLGAVQDGSGPDYEYEPAAPPPPRTGREAARLYVPVYGLASAGTRVELDHAHVVDQVPVEELLGGRAVTANRFMIEVLGTSMEPRYRPGERVLCVKNRHPRAFEDAVFEMADGHAELKTFMRRSQGVIWYDQCAEDGDGDKDQPRYFRESDVKALHAVIGRF